MLYWDLFRSPVGLPYDTNLLCLALYWFSLFILGTFPDSVQSILFLHATEQPYSRENNPLRIILIKLYLSLPLAVTETQFVGKDVDFFFTVVFQRFQRTQKLTRIVTSLVRLYARYLR